MSMNFIIIKNLNNFQQIIESPIFIGCDKARLNMEISTNMWAISIAPKTLKNISLDYLSEFVKNLLHKKLQQISQLAISCPVIFYMWFDEMPSQLRFNIISESHNQLPFACKLNIINLPEKILINFLKSQHNQIIPWTDLIEITDDSDEVEEIPFILDVFVIQLNK